MKKFIDEDTIYKIVLKDIDITKAIKPVKKICNILYPNKIHIDYFSTNFFTKYYFVLYFL